jgi:hypothetical protein
MYVVYIQLQLIHIVHSTKYNVNKQMLYTDSVQIENREKLPVILECRAKSLPRGA